MIFRIYVPVGSLAATILREWQDAGLNRSDEARKAIERHAATEADRRKILALGWALAQRGICPAVMVPMEDVKGTSKFPIITKPTYTPAHSCEACRRWTGTHAQREMEGVSPNFAQSVIQPIYELWRGFDWSETDE